MFVGSGGSGRGSGSTVCSSQTKGATTVVPSKEGTVGGRAGQGGANVCCDTIIHTLKER